MVYLIKFSRMIFYYYCKNCKPLMVGFFAAFLIVQSQACAQTVISTKGYGKAQYSASEAGKFMKTWLIAGPFSVAADSAQPDSALQEKVFKTDILSAVNVTAGKPAPPISASQKEFNWQLVSSADDIIDLESFFKRKDFVYAYALAEIKADAPTSVMLAIGSDDGIKVWHNGNLYTTIGSRGEYRKTMTSFL